MNRTWSMMLALLLYSNCFSQPVDSVRADKWRKDIEVLEKQMPALHVNLFHSMTKKQFDAYIFTLKNNLHNWSENKIVTEVTRIFGELRDGHSGVAFDISDPSKGYTFRFFPLHFEQLDDGIVLLHAPVNFKNLIGRRLVAINNTPTDKVITSLRPLMAKDDDNTYAVKAGVRFNIVNATYLNGLGITDDASTATFHVEDENRNVTAITVRSLLLVDLLRTMYSPEAVEVPLFRQQPRKNYWAKYLPREKVLYIKYTVEQNDPNEPIPMFARKIGKLVDSVDLDKTVVDLRNNQGGDIGTFPALINLITRNPKINRKGRLFVIMNRYSQSAATVFINRLELNSDAVLIGEPTLSRPNLYCNPTSVTLPNTLLKVGLSTAFLEESLDIDDRLYIAPQIQVPFTSTDYLLGRDPLLEAALNYSAPVDKDRMESTYNQQVMGRYRYSALRTAEIVNPDPKTLILRIADIDKDFINLQLYATGGNSFLTDMPGFNVTFDPRTRQLKFLFHGKEKKLVRLPADHQTLVDIIRKKDLKAFSTGLNTELSKLNPYEKKKLESVINSWGYSYVGNKQYDDAIKIFELNTRIFPLSANAFDSLAEAYMLRGDKPEAIKFYKRALEMNPNSDNAKNKIADLESTLR